MTSYIDDIIQYLYDIKSQPGRGIIDSQEVC